MDNALERKPFITVVTVSIATSVALGLALVGLLAPRYDTPTDPYLKIGVVDLDTSVGYPGADLSDEFILILHSQPSISLLEYNTTSAANNSLFQGGIIGYLTIEDGFEFNVSARIPAFIPMHVGLANRLIFAEKINDAIVDFKATFNFTANEIYATAPF